jgi:hypothetical protein
MPDVDDVTALVHDPSASARAIAVLAQPEFKDAVARVLESKALLPPSLGRVRCLNCLLLLSLKQPSKASKNYCRYVQKQWAYLKESEGRIHDHLNCPMEGGTDVCVYAYHFMMMAKACHTQCAKGPPGVSGVCKHEGRHTNSGGEKDFAVAETQEQAFNRKMEMQDQLYGEAAFYAEFGESWADAMEYQDAMDAIDAINAELPPEYRRTFEPPGHNGGLCFECETEQRSAEVLHSMQQVEVWFNVFSLLKMASLKDSALLAYKAQAFKDMTEHEIRAADLYTASARAILGEPVEVQAEGAIYVSNDAKIFPVPLSELDAVIAQLTADGERKMVEHAAKVAEVRAANPKRNETIGTPVSTGLEAECRCSVKDTFGTNTAVVRNGLDIRGAVVMADAGQSYVFATHRHQVIDGQPVDCPWKVGDVVQLCCYANTPVKGKLAQLEWIDVTIAAVSGQDGRDIQWCFFESPGLYVPNRRIKVPERGATVAQFTFRVTGDEYAWMMSIGQVVDLNSVVAFYNFTTTPGDCGFPVYASDGTLVCCHLFGNARWSGDRKANAGQLYARLQHPGKGVTRMPLYDPCTLACELQGVVPGKLNYVLHPERRRMVERVRINGLRKDVNLKGLMPEHFFMKPSTEMNARELDKFADVIDCQLDPELLRKAVTAAVMMDLCDPVEVPFVEPTAASVRKAFLAMDWQRSAGASAGSVSAGDYVRKLGDGDVVAGTDVLVQRVLRLYSSMLGVGPVDKELLEEMRYWSVIGKKDGYKTKKLPPTGSGRTIQAPSLELKVLWLACFGESDQTWLNRGPGEGRRGLSWVHQGDDADLPCHYTTVATLLKARSCFAGDITGFDRYMMRELMVPFFMQYLPMVATGVPLRLCAFLAHYTIDSLLVLSDGRVAQKHRGNPSGFMNTLRLNCVVHLIALMYVILKRRPHFTVGDAVAFAQEDLHIQVCGDDSRIFALTPEGEAFLDVANGGAAYLQEWNESLPWEVKVEGLAVFSAGESLITRAYRCPPMVSRQFVVVDGTLWEPLYNYSRCLKRLACSEYRTPDEEEAIISSAFTTLALPIYWATRQQKALASPVLDMLVREFGTQGWRTGLALAYRRANNLYAVAAARMGSSVSSARPCKLW